MNGNSFINSGCWFIDANYCNTANSRSSAINANHPVCLVLRPEKELKAFEKVFLKQGETKTIELIIKVADLAFYDEVKKDWNVEAGEFVLHIGNSSNNISEKIGIAVR